MKKHLGLLIALGTLTLASFTLFASSPELTPTDDATTSQTLTVVNEVCPRGFEDCTPGECENCLNQGEGSCLRNGANSQGKSMGRGMRRGNCNR